MIINPYRFSAAGGGIPTDYRAAYLFDSTGSTAVDEAGNYDGAIVGATQASGILTLDGAGDYVTIGNAIDDTMGSGFSISAWIKTAADGQIVSNYQGAGSFGGFNFHVTGSKLRLILGTDNFAAYIGELSTATVDDDAWHHVCGTWDGTEGDSAGIELYIDGSPAASSAVTNGTYTWGSSTVDMRIGARGDVTQLFNGDMDSVRIYDRELTASEVGTLNAEGHD